jgi:hypothetical protein
MHNVSGIGKCEMKKGTRQPAQQTDAKFKITSSKLSDFLPNCPIQTQLLAGFGAVWSISTFGWEVQSVVASWKCRLFSPK